MEPATHTSGARGSKDEDIERRLLLVDADSRDVLVDDAGQLPTMTMAHMSRRGLAITGHVREAFGIETVCLFVTDDGVAVLERVEPDAGLPPGTALVARDTFRQTPGDAPIVRALDELECPCDPARTPFGRAGWIRDLRAWCTPHLRSGERLTRDITPWKAGPFVALVRLQTSAGRALWFKGAMAATTREWRITAYLARCDSHALPDVIATRPEWNGLLMADSGGPALVECLSLSACVSAAERLAKLQVACVDAADGMRALDCDEWPLSRLASMARDFLRAMEPVFAAQPQTPPARLSGRELDELANDVEAACAEMQALGIPDGVVNVDLTPRNTCVTPRGPVFIDWANSYISHPFFSYQYFRHSVGRIIPAANIGAMDQAYRRAWEARVPGPMAERALRLAPPLAAMLCAIVCSRDERGWQFDARRQAIRRTFVRHTRDALSAYLQERG